MISSTLVANLQTVNSFNGVPSKVMQYVRSPKKRRIEVMGGKNVKLFIMMHL